MTRLLAVRLDAAGDMLLTGPAIRALRRGSSHVDVLASPAGEAAARLLPEVADVLVFDAPWSGYAPPAVDADATRALVADLDRRRYDGAVIFTSFHQSPLPMAMLARLAGIGFVAATSEDYPGSLLDVRHRRAAPPGGGHEVEAMLDLAEAAGAPPRRNAEDRRLAVRRPLPALPGSVDALPGPYVVVHPGASVPSRSLSGGHARAIVTALRVAGRRVVVTGAPTDRALCAEAAAVDGVVDLCGATDLAGLAAVLDAASCLVAGNTGPAHLAAAVGTPVVSLFSPVVPASRWAPYGVDVVLLGDQHAPCRDTRARECPVPGHPCLSGVDPRDVVAAVADLTTSDDKAA
ncbi:glycosyltransferase family 9 protein [Mobilicoccus massiliensis]|uniref:glycosyltransferase family 9 protein n=1 Tax=Mobilicoccus massiliensis TaxID=1522310 RepID=UPI00058DBBD9|nr:glycosyltransferase family 9 protein [Mobilicoccus massiliensis]